MHTLLDYLAVCLVQQRHTDENTSQHLSGVLVECSTAILGRPAGIPECTAAMVHLSSLRHCWAWLKRLVASCGKSVIIAGLITEMQRAWMSNQKQYCKALSENERGLWPTRTLHYTTVHAATLSEFCLYSDITWLLQLCTELPEVCTCLLLSMTVSDILVRVV